MAEQPAASRSLVELLSRLQLATAGQVQSVAGLVARLTSDLPQFDSVWVDALAQARVLSPFQAAQINAGRGDALQIGSYVLRSELPGPGYARCHTAVGLTTRQPARLLVVDHAERPLGDIGPELAQLVEQSRLIDRPALAVVRDAGIEGTRIWAACRPVAGTTAARWMVENGRLPAGAVLHVARQMVAALAELEQFELVHGDLSVLGLLLTEDGRIVLTHPGLRSIVRPIEGYAYGNLTPEAYDTLAPERIATAARVSTATDVYACGCVWWHLATGRPPFAGGNTIAKLRAVHSGKTTDVERLAPDVPAVLARAIRACTAHNPAERPASMAVLSEMLGPASRTASTSLRRLLDQPQGPRRLWGSPHRRRDSLASRLGNATAVAVCLGLLLGASFGWRYRHQLAFWPRWNRGEIGPAATGLALDKGQSERASDSARIAPDKSIAGAKPSRHGRAAPSKAQSAVGESTGQDRVSLAGHQVVENQAASKAVEPRLLATDRPLRLGELDVLKGQTVRGADGRRPLVYVPVDGLTVRGERVCFENVDFVWDATLPTIENEGEPLAIVKLNAEQAEFRGCSFQDARSQTDRIAAARRPLAILWSAAPSTPARRAALGGDMICDNCVFSEVDAAVECRAGRAPSIEVSQSLHLLSGPLVRLAFCPRRDQAVMLSVSSTTVRMSAAVLECRADQPARDNLPAGKAAADVGQITVTAVDSVFALDATAALVLFTGAEPSDALLTQLEWTGQGSLVTPTAVIAAWRADRDATPRSLAEDRLQVAGLVRSQVEFVGDASAGPAAARMRRWQAPLRSDEPPGVGPGRLTLPAAQPLRR